MNTPPTATVRDIATEARSHFTPSEFAGKAEEVATVAFHVCTRVRLGMAHPTVAAALLRRLSADHGTSIPVMLDLQLLRVADVLAVAA